MGCLPVTRIPRRRRAVHRWAVRTATTANPAPVGGSIEDYDPSGEIYPVQYAAERVAAAVEAARRLDFPFTLTARAENHIRGNPDLDDTVTRLLAYERAGAPRRLLHARGTHPDHSGARRLTRTR